MRTVKETQTVEATPEQLLQIIDSQLASQRSHRAGAGRNRAMILVMGLLFILIAAGAALLVLEQMLSDLRQNGAVSPKEATSSRGNF